MVHLELYPTALHQIFMLVDLRMRKQTPAPKQLSKLVPRFFLGWKGKHSNTTTQHHTPALLLPRLLPYPPSWVCFVPSGISTATNSSSDSSFSHLGPEIIREVSLQCAGDALRVVRAVVVFTSNRLSRTTYIYTTMRRLLSTRLFVWCK